MIFYHASIKKFSVGEQIAVNPRRGYVCVATHLRQAIYWTGLLFGDNAGRPQPLSSVTIYLVDVPDEDEVEDCVGHYAFEYAGVKKPAGQVNFHDHESDLDGEVVIRKPVTVVGQVDDVDLEVAVPALKRELHRQVYGY